MRPLDKIIEAVEEMTGEKPSPDDTLESLELDSLDALDLVFELEKEFNVEIQQLGLEELAPMTLSGLAGTIEELQRKVA